MTPASLSRNARLIIAIDAIVVALLWFVWSPMLFVWHSDHTGALTMLLVAAGLSTRGLRKALLPEVTSDPLPFRRLTYVTAKWLCLAMVAGQIVVAFALHTTFVWIISSTIVVIAGALLLHEWIELRQVEQKRPNHSPETNALTRE